MVHKDYRDTKNDLTLEEVIQLLFMLPVTVACCLGIIYIFMSI